MDSEKTWSELRSRRCTVVGFGKSNRPLVELLLSKGISVSVRDQKTKETLSDEADRLEALGVRLILGEGYLDGIDEDVIFRSPGLRPDIPAFAEAVKRGARLTSEMELFMDLTPATVIGITGSDGKTTTTTLTGLILQNACRRRGYGRVFVGGNIGEPLLPKVEEMTADDFAVVELSSFQLQTMQKSPHYAAVTNITPNHLNWHTDMEEYVRAKTAIFRGSDNRRLVVNAENDRTQRLGCEHEGAVTWFSSKKDCKEDFSSLMRGVDRAVYLQNGKIFLWDGSEERRMLCAADILLPGTHNIENYMTAIALTEDFAKPADIGAVATSFGGVRHRLERVRRIDGVTYYNSSIDSTPTRTAAALSALAPQKPIVICGGYDKNIPFAPLADVLCERAKAVILTGATAQKIFDALLLCPAVQNGELPIYRESDFERAVQKAREVAGDGDLVLLSPACASFDAFRDFEARGERFCEIVNGFSSLENTK